MATTTLDRLERTLSPGKPYHLKLDLQGGEMAALRGAASAIQSTLTCEVELSFTELYEGAASWQDIAAHLSSLDFIICDIERVFFDPVSKDLLQVNALYRRSSLNV